MSASRANPQRPGGAKRRGSVLVFTVLLLVLLAGIGTAFVMFVNMEYAASGNALRNTQSRSAAETGLAHAQYVLRESILQCRFETPDGFFTDAIGATRPFIDDTPGVFRFFEYHPTLETVATAKSAFTADKSGQWASWRDFAWLYWNVDTANCGVANEDGAVNPHAEREMTDHTYTESPLAHSAYPNGQIRIDRSNGIQHAGLARRFVIYNPVTDFYPDASKAVSPYRGEYYIWVADLDGKLFAPYSGETWGMADAADASGTLSRLSDYGYSGPVGWGFDASGSFRMNLTASEITALAAKPGRYSSIEDMAVFLNRTPPASGTGSPVWNHLFYRYGLERYFTCWADDERAVKVHETALNVNTASYEVLAAALSRIPLVDVGVDMSENRTKASYLAKRICAKRPFVCRIDFEDFLAAHLNADPTGTTIDEPTVDATPQPPVRMLYLAIPKRDYTDAKDTSVPRTVLKLSQLMETPVSDTDTRYAWLRSGVAQQARFSWFRMDDTAAPLVYTDPVSGVTYTAFLSVKAFNNILNSISGQQSGGYGYSFYSYDGVPAPFTVDVSGTQTAPKFIYNELTQTVIDGGRNIYTVEGLDPAVHTEGGELAAWRLTNTSGYYEMVFKHSDDLQLREYYESALPAPAPVISGGLDGALETPHSTDDTPSGTDIVDGGNLRCDTTIHGPLRAYWHDLDPDATDADPAVNAGDVSWSPRFCFRSRFFKIYVLARSIVTLKGDGTPVYGPTSRLEAVYDAADDKILWRRWQATELRRLSDPVP